VIFVGTKNDRRIPMLALLTAMLMAAICLLPVGTMADVEPNNDFDVAESIYVPSIVTGHINNNDKDDIYRMTVDRGQSLKIRAEPDHNLGINLYLYMQKGTGASATYEQVAVHRAATIGVSKGVPRSINYTTNSAQDSYTMFSWVGYYEGEGNYNLSIEVSNQDDADTGTDAAETYEGAATINPGTYDGFVANADDEDLYRVELVKGDSIYVDVWPDVGLSVNLHLIRKGDNDGLPTYTEVTRDKRTGDEGRGQARHVEFTLNSEEKNTTFFVKVYRDQDHGEYQMKVTVDHQNDGGSGTDAGDLELTATGITETGAFTGFLKGLDVMDHYTFTLTDRERLIVNVTPGSEMTVSLSLKLDGTTVSEDKAKHPEYEMGQKRSVNVTLPRTDKKVALLQVKVDTGNGNYSLDVTIIPKLEDHEPPVVTLVEPVPGSSLWNKKIRDYRGTATDYNNVTVVEISLDKVIWHTCTLQGSDGSYTWNGSMRFNRTGNNTVYVRASDNMGNQGITTFYVYFKKDEKKGFIPGIEAIPVMVALILVTVMVTAVRKRR
jgi:hypothetical protein